MASRGQRRARWIDSAHLLWEADEDGHGYHWGEVVFEDVPLGSGDLVHVSVRTGMDDRGAIVILGFDLDKPINARRLKALPLAAIRNECARILLEEAEQEARRMKSGPAEEGLEVTKARLARLATSDRQSPEFLALIAEVVRQARARGVGGWNAVSEALSHPDGRPMSRAMAQRYMKRATEAGHDLSSLSRSTDLATRIHGESAREGE